LKFADDTKLFGVVQSRDDHQGLQHDLSTLFQWSKGWQMEFNVGKCKIMHIGRENKKYRYYMNGQELEAVPT
jgi:hypothetical protein